jgi:hypothetical protein
MSIAGTEANSSRPCIARRESSFLFTLRNIASPFRGAEPSGETPTGVEDDPFDNAVTESISVGSVPVHVPRLTDPIAPCTGFAMEAEVVKHASRFAEFRKAQRKSCPEKVSRADESEGGLFFASRTRGRSPQVRKEKSFHRVQFVIACHDSYQWVLQTRSTRHRKNPSSTISRWTYLMSAS